MIQFFSETFKIYYYAPWFSLASFITILLYIVVILLPFFTQFSHEKFWEKIDTYYETPEITQLGHNYFKIINKNGEMEKNGTIIVANSSKSLSFTITEDMMENNNPIIFAIYLKVYFPSLNYKFNAPLIFTIKSAQKGSEYTYDLVFKQKKPLKVKNKIQGKIENDKLITYLENTNEEKNFDLIYDYIKDRNYSFGVKNMVEDENSNTGTSVTINYDSFNVLYNLPPLYTLKFRWIEYLAVLIPTVYIVGWFLEFIYKNNIFECSVVSSIPKKLI